MFDSHLKMNNKEFYLHLLGIAAHVYLDTFSHYGFSGISSDLNSIDNTSIKFEKTPVNESYILSKAVKFLETYAGEIGSRSMGHGAVATYPDRPYLLWSFKYEEARNNTVESGLRNNQETFLEGLEKLHEKLSEGAERMPDNSSKQDFDADKIKTILALEANKDSRIKEWKSYIAQLDEGEEPEYLGDQWNKEKESFSDGNSQSIGNCYRFHQAAAYHRWYTLKDLLPAHSIYAV